MLPTQWIVRVTIGLTFMVGLVLTGGCATDKAVISQANDMHQALEPAVMEDPQLANYIQEVGDRIIETAKDLHRQGYETGGSKEDSEWMFSKDMRFHLVNSKTLNAFTTGGEHMYIYNELFQQVKDEDELAAVMAHEFAHVYARHVHKGMNRQYAMLGAAAAAGAAGYAAGGKDSGASYAQTFAGATLVAGQFIGMGYTREDENEADKLGFAFYTHAGWDPNQFAGFFQTMIDKGYDTTPEMASDHPTLASRVDNTKRRVGELDRKANSWRREPVANPSDFHRLQQRAAELGKTMPNDESLSGAQKLLTAFPSCVTPLEQPGQVQAERDVMTEAQREADRREKQKKH